MSQNFCQHENQKLLPLAKEFWVSYNIKNDHKVTNIISFLYKFFCRKRKSYHTEQVMHTERTTKCPMKYKMH